MKKFEKVILGSLVVGTTLSSSLVFIQAEKLGETQYYLTDNLNMRKGPSTDNIIILTIPKGNTVNVMEFSSDNNWAKVNYNNQTGWVSTTYIEKITSQGDNNVSKYEDYITTSSVNVRTGPSVNYKKIGVLSKDVE